MSSRTWGAIVGAGLLGLFVFGIAALLASWHVDRAYRHVVIEVFNIDDVAGISVNCERARAVPASAGAASVDLGWLSPDDRVSISERNNIGDAAWGFRIVSNGEVVFDKHRGQARVAGFKADEWAVVMAKSFTADGDPIGTIGCSGPLVVSDRLPNYQVSPDSEGIETTDGIPARWKARTSPYALIETLGDWSLRVLAIVGFVAGFSIARVRRLIRKHWKLSLASAVLGLVLNLGRELGPEGLLLFGELVGILLLLLSAVVAIWPHTGSCCLSSCSTPDPKPNPE